jgi:hypothetical protein
MCEYSGIDDPQRYTKEELSSEEIERRIRSIIKVGRDEKLELKIPMYENGNCPEVSAFFFRRDCLFLSTDLHSFVAFLPSPSELSRLVRYPWSKELTDDDETSPSPKRHKSSPVAKEARPSCEEPMAEEPVATVHHGVRGSGGRMRSLGKRVISCHPSPALRGHLETVPESTATIKLPERK